MRLLTAEAARQTKDALDATKNDDGTWNQCRAAERLGIARATLQGRIKAIRDGRVQPEPEPPSHRPRVRVRAYTQHTPPEGQRRRVCAIGDIHDAPGKPKDHLRWISRWIADRAPDNAVYIGDVFTLDSMSSHDAPGSAGYYERPAFPQDMESAEEAMAALNSEFEAGQIKVDVTLGNHEHRAWRAEENAPNLKDTLVLPIRQLFARHRWGVKDYGDWLFLDGVGFTHVPFNQMGKDYRGKTPENQIGNDATHSIVFGHTHKRRVAHFPKIGPNNRVTVLNLGTAMEYGVVEHYASLSVTGWTYGVYELTLQGGQIVGESYVSMLDLEDRYA